MKMQYVVIDLETYGHKTYKRFCNPLDPEHYVVATAYKHQKGKAQVDFKRSGFEVDEILGDIDLDSVNLLVGQNFKFDMLWFWGDPRLQEWLRNGGQVWDTLQAEYHLRGQQGIAHGGKSQDGLSLDVLAVKYGGTSKDVGVKDIFKNGGTVLDIPKKQLIEYAKYDAINTEIVFRKQIKQAKKRGMLNIIRAYNEHVLAVTEIEYNGMYVNTAKAKIEATNVERQLMSIKAQIEQILVDNELWPQELLSFNIASPNHLAKLFWGGPLKVSIRERILNVAGEVVKFVTGARVGQIKTRLQESIVMVVGLNEVFDKEWETTAGNKGTSGEVLEDLQTRTDNQQTKNIIELLLEYRKQSKILSTYLYKKTGKKESGLVPLVHPDGCLHSEYSTAYTKTGRLSSEKPNLQNIPPTISDLFESRYGSGGCIVELDFSQLEIVVQAYITQCDDMISDVENGVDFHCLRLSYAEDRDYDEVYALCQTDPIWKLKRKKAKIISFQKSYGAHPSKIAKETGLSESTIVAVFDKEDARYPETQQYCDNVTEYLDNNCVRSDRPLEVRVNGVYKTDYTKRHMIGQYQTITGKLYTFYKKAVRTPRGLFQYWSGPHIKNYPVQGTAADIVAMQVGRVFRYMINHRDKGLMVNEIHDSIVLDVKIEHRDMITREVKEILEDVSGSFKTQLGLEFNAPIRVDTGTGANWLEAK